MSKVVVRITSVLIKAKNHLAVSANEMYFERRNELNFDEYQSHFQDLAEILADIDQIVEFSEIITRLENGRFERIGYFPSDDDMLETFLDNIK